MSKDRQGTIRAIWLGQRLKELRDQAGLTVRDACTFLKKVPSTISRMEGGTYPVTETDVDGYLDMCGVNDPHKRTDLRTICIDVAQRGWWDGYTGDVAAVLMDRAWMESKAVKIRSFEPLVIPGLIQVPPYAAALMRAKNPAVPDLSVSRWVDMRMKRQHALTQHAPVRFEAIVDEHVLSCPVGDGETMRQQFDHLLKMIKMDNVELRILPSGTCTGLEGAFEVFDLQSPYPKVAYAMTTAGDICLEGQPVEELSAAYDRLLKSCLTPTATRELINKKREKL